MLRPLLLACLPVAASAQGLDAILPPGACWEVAYGAEYGRPEGNPASPVAFLQVVVADPSVGESLGWAGGGVIVDLVTKGSDARQTEAFPCADADGRAWCDRGGDGGSFELLPQADGGLSFRGPYVTIGDAFVAGEVQDSGIHELRRLDDGACL